MDAPAMEDPARGRRGDLLMATARDIAEWVGAEGPAVDAEIARVSGLQGATADAVVFAVEQESLDAAVASRAGAILANEKLKKDGEPCDQRIVWVRDARLAFAVAAGRLAG